jgi:Protein of unknown function (DUF2934)
MDDRFETIQKKAYHLWAAAGYPPSDGVYFWVKAEEEYDEECFNSGMEKMRSIDKILKIKPVQKAIEAIPETVKNAEVGSYLSSFLNKLRGKK